MEEVICILRATAIHGCHKNDVGSPGPLLFGVGVCTAGQSPGKRIARARDAGDKGRMVQWNCRVCEGERSLSKYGACALQHALGAGFCGRAGPRQVDVSTQGEYGQSVWVDFGRNYRFETGCWSIGPRSAWIIATFETRRAGVRCSS